MATFPKIAGLNFSDLQTERGIAQLDQAFLAHLQAQNPGLSEHLKNYRAGAVLEPKALSYFLLDVAPYIEQFIVHHFEIGKAAQDLQQEIIAQDPIFAFKELYVLRDAKRDKRYGDALAFNFSKLTTELFALAKLPLDADELAFARFAMSNPECKDQAIEWCVAALSTNEGQAFVKNWVSFKLPEKLDYQYLVPTQKIKRHGVDCLELPENHLRQRDGFHLTDKRMSEREVLSEVHYCVYCHKNDGDFCSKGFPVKKSQPELGFKKNPLDQTLAGCPLDEKISEMHTLKRAGLSIAALAMVMLDNPMCPATGHRICNDCMKACIYQKQTPVNIPQIETRVLTDVLRLPWGVEIYHLLTRWNPLRQDQFVEKPYNGKKILIMGMGPAGFTLSHHLLMEGFAIAGVDGLKIEVLDNQFVNEPVYRYEELEEDLANRVMTGFGGVAEYGITVRWDKNFLKLIYLSLTRRRHFQVFGGVRFGGTVCVEDAWRLGFDHLAIAVGAGLPRELNVKNSLAPGMRQANDFLMALQLTGAAKQNSLANLQLRLPAIVIGGGLTGIDTATEAQAYYISQVEKITHRYNSLIKNKAVEKIRAEFDDCSLQILDEYLAHGAAVIAERKKAIDEKRAPNFIHLLRQWGGVTVAYRRSMQESPAYRSNHEEVAKALEEGIYYAENLQPIGVILDEFGHTKALECENIQNQEKITWPARSVLVATGARPNVAYEFEHKGTFLKIQGNYARFEFDGDDFVPVEELGNCKIKHFGPFTSYAENDRRVTFLGDTHPVFHGNVVKAIASAKRTYPAISALFPPEACSVDDSEYEKFANKLATYFAAELIASRQLTPNALKITVRAPAVAHNFKAGQFYRIQNYETQAQTIDGTLLQSEAIAALGKREKNSDELSFIILNRGVSSRLVATFEIGKPIAIMGPTGVKARITEKPETIMIVGGELAIAYLRSVGPALREQGSKVVFVADIKDEAAIFCRDELEQEATDHILWVSAQNAIKTQRLSDRSEVGELFSIIDNSASDWLKQCDRIIGIGDACMIKALQNRRHAQWKSQLKENASIAVGVYGPMQCMLKGVCAQCLVWQIDPQTGERKKAVYACSWQEQPVELVEAANLEERLVQNRTQETLSDLWLDQIL